MHLCGVEYLQAVDPQTQDMDSADLIINLDQDEEEGVDYDDGDDDGAAGALNAEDEEVEDQEDLVSHGCMHVAVLEACAVEVHNCKVQLQLLDLMCSEPALLSSRCLGLPMSAILRSAALSLLGSGPQVVVHGLPSLPTAWALA